ncbi:MAG TPA: aminotransferase class I/II-fold pyridoxal phosphate-dependent enzyme, partial [Nitrospirae bacterium]|nr:aminotransferase class I/II-fold pyridoxal phosphate-dependent enzyme [Nitrospirota bacterium]
HDAAYSEIYYDGQRPMSFLQVRGARDVGIEVHSLSKTYNMTGWRIGFAAGSANVIAGLGKIKSNFDSGVFQAVQEAGIEALNTPEPILRKIRDVYQERREILYNGLKDLGLIVEKPRATFYFWTKVPEGYTSATFVSHLLNKAGVLITPGNGFGGLGEGYVRFSLTVPARRIKQAINRIKKVL